MAAVTVVKPRPVTPPAYEFNQEAAQAAVDLTAGTIVTPTAATPALGFQVVVDKLATADAGGQKKKFMVLRDAKAGRVVDLGSHGEIDGYSGLTPGAPLYPSGSVAGGIDTVAATWIATTPPVPAVAQMWAVSTARIYFAF